MASKPKLTYGNGRGLAELPRLALVEAGIEFEDVRWNDDDWDTEIAKLKATGVLPFGQVPFFEVQSYLHGIGAMSISATLKSRSMAIGSDVHSDPWLYEAIYKFIFHRTDLFPWLSPWLLFVTWAERAICKFILLDFFLLLDLRK